MPCPPSGPSKVKMSMQSPCARASAASAQLTESISPQVEGSALALRSSPGRAANGIEVRFVAGYGSGFADVPQPLRQGIVQLAAFLFENRGDAVSEAAILDSGAAGLWQPYTVARL